MQDYSKFIFIPKELEEKISKYTEEELNIIASYISYSLRKTQQKLNDDLLKQSKP